jgi:hypothetical protein
LKPLESILERMVLGQMTTPPNTAIATPLQQAISNLQSGGRGSMPGGLGNLPNNGLQTREQLGLPDRRSYFPGLPTTDEAAALGAFPGIMSNPRTVKQGRRQQGLLPKKDRGPASHPELGPKKEKP